MSAEPIANVEKTSAPEASATENAYLGIGLVAIVILGFVCWQGGIGRWSVIPPLIGAAGLAFRWRSAPLVLLAAVAFTQLAPYSTFGEAFGFRPAQPTTLAIGISLCGATLAYVVAQYRLFGLTATVFPTDPRQFREQLPPRDISRISGQEVPTALVTVAAATVGVFFVWEVVSSIPPQWGIPKSRWTAGLLGWMTAAVLTLLASVIAYLGWNRLSRDEASIYLRDVLWRETRGEQRRVQRWRAWARQRSR